MDNFNLTGNLRATIKRLTVPDGEKKQPSSSPSLRHLTKGPSRVKKMTEVFEEKSKTYSARTNWWLEDKSQILEFKNTQSPAKPRSSISRINERLSISNSPLKLTTKLDRIVHELLQKELTYIDALERGIDYYLKALLDSDLQVPAIIRKQTFRLFGNIEHICKLHKDSVYPRFVICQGNPRLIAETLSSFIQNELFYCYIVYATNQKSADQLIADHSAFFENLRATSDDLLGVQSFVIQPIQKLPRYKMLLDEMIREMSRNIAEHKDAVAACCVAEKNVQRLLTRLNEALTINDIIETRESNEQLKSLISMQRDFGVSFDEPMMMLMPKTSSNFPFRSPFNVYSLGKFYKCSSLKAFECSTNRTFPSKVFIFETCLLYTKIINESSLGYRNHFPFGPTCSFNTKDSQVSFRVCGASKKQDVIFSSDNIESIAEMKKLINQFYDPRRSADSAFVDGNELMICEDQDITSDDDDDWIVADFSSNGSPNETLHVANSRFYVKSPDPNVVD